MIKGINDTTSLIYKFFQQLRSAGFYLGIEEYYLFLNLLRSGYSIQSKGDLLNLCKYLWLKSEKDLNDFEYYFKISFQILGDDLFLVNKSASELNAIKKNQNISGDKSSSVEPREQKIKERLGGEEFIEEFVTDELNVIDKELQESNLKFSEMNFQEKTIELTKKSIRKFTFKYDYIPITRRSLMTSWRYIYPTLNAKSSKVLDVEETIQKIGKTGFFLEPVFKNTKIKDRLILLLDVSKSMIAFRSLSERVANTALNINVRKNVNKFYFAETPDIKNLFRDVTLNEKVQLINILENNLEINDTLLVISDAGAAKGIRENKRVNETLKFLNKIKSSVECIVWINPMPIKRWRRNTAYEISRQVNMFPASTEGVRAAIQHLRKK